MAVDKVLQYDNRDAGADLTGKLRYAAKLDTSGDLVLAGAGEDVYGIIYEEATSGNGCTVAVAGIVKAIAGASINEGVPLAADANGKLITATTGDSVFGYARVAAASGDIFEVLVDRGQNAA